MGSSRSHIKSLVFHLLLVFLKADIFRRVLKKHLLGRIVGSLGFTGGKILVTLEGLTSGVGKHVI